MKRLTSMTVSALTAAGVGLTAGCSDEEAREPLAEQAELIAYFVGLSPEPDLQGLFSAVANTEFELQAVDYGTPSSTLYLTHVDSDEGDLECFEVRLVESEAPQIERTTEREQDRSSTYPPCFPYRGYAMVPEYLDLIEPDLAAGDIDSALAKAETIDPAWEDDLGDYGFGAYGLDIAETDAGWRVTMVLYVRPFHESAMISDTEVLRHDFDCITADYAATSDGLDQSGLAEIPCGETGLVENDG